MKFLSLFAILFSLSAQAATTLQCETIHVPGNYVGAFGGFSVTLDGDKVTGSFIDQYSGPVSIDNKEVFTSVASTAAGERVVTILYTPYRDSFEASFVFKKGMGTLREHDFVDCRGEADLTLPLNCR